MLNLDEKELEKETKPKEKVYLIGFCFFGQGAIECMVKFRIDSHTIKKETLKQLCLSSAAR